MVDLQQELAAVEEDFLLQHVYLLLVIMLQVDLEAVQMVDQMLKMQQLIQVVVEVDHLNLIQEVVEQVDLV